MNTLQENVEKEREVQVLEYVAPTVNTLGEAELIQAFGPAKMTVPGEEPSGFI